MEGNMQKILETAVRVIWVEEDAEWRAEFEEYGFMCGNESDRRCYGFTVDVYKAEEADDTFSFWITEEDFEKIG